MERSHITSSKGHIHTSTTVLIFILTKFIEFFVIQRTLINLALMKLYKMNYVRKSNFAFTTLQIFYKYINY